MADIYGMAAEQYYQALEWISMRSMSDPPNGQYAYPDAAYGIMSWWDYGHLIETVGHRIPNANPFQQGIGSVTTGVAGSSPFFLAENESQAEKVLAVWI